MPILIACPKCGTSLKAPEHLAGRAVKCPKCATQLTVPSLVVQAPPPLSVVAAPPPAPPRHGYDEDDEPRRAPRRRRDRHYDDDDDRPRERAPREGANAQMGLGIAALCIGCVAIVVSVLPCIGLFIGMPIAGVGLLLGVVGLIIALVQKGRGIGFPIAGSSVNVVALLICVVWYLIFVKGAEHVVQGAQQLDKLAKDLEEHARKNKEKQEKQEKIEQKDERILPNDRTTSTNNLKQLALAMHAYHDAHRMMPSAGDGRVGKGMLSWRVALLPYIENDNLHKQFRLNEPWDSPNNKKLLDLMPNVYKSPKNTAAAGMTHYQVFTGKGPFGRPTPPKLTASFKDGTSSTFLIVEAGTAVPWTKPEDLKFDGTQLPNLSGPYGNQFFAAMGDGTVRLIRHPQPYTDQLLRAIITPDGAEAVNFPD
jgi:hypothetical protein